MLRLAFDSLETGREQTMGAVAVLRGGLHAGLRRAQRTSDTEEAFTAATPVLTRQAAIDRWIMLGLNDESVVGGVRAAEGLSMTPDAIIGIGIGGSQAAIAELSKPRSTGFVASVLLSPRAHGYGTAATLYRWITRGLRPPAETLTSGTLMTRQLPHAAGKRGGGMTPLLEFRNVGKVFPGVVALDDIGFAVAPGEVRALIGEDGAGKSTLLKILAGHYADDSATLVMDGTARHAASLRLSARQPGCGDRDHPSGAAAVPRPQRRGESDARRAASERRFSEPQADAQTRRKPLGLRCNAILPGAIDTPLLHASPTVRSGVEVIDPADIGTPDDVAALALFLASEAARFITGEGIVADGRRMGKL